jgi:hypothetical protein
VSEKTDAPSASTVIEFLLLAKNTIDTIDPETLATVDWSTYTDATVETVSEVERAEYVRRSTIAIADSLHDQTHAIVAALRVAAFQGPA